MVIEPTGRIDHLGSEVGDHAADVLAVRGAAQAMASPERSGLVGIVRGKELLERLRSLGYLSPGPGPDAREVAQNRRSRSAILRAAEKLPA